MALRNVRRDIYHHAGHKMLDQRADLTDRAVKQQSTWGMSVKRGVKLGTGDRKNPSGKTKISSQNSSSFSIFGEYDRETIERVHRENIQRSKEALAASKDIPEAQVKVQKKRDPIFGIQPPQKPRRVFDSEISPYQGFGDKKQMQRAQSRKRRQVRNRERSMWDNIAPKKYHGLLTFIYIAIFIAGLVIISVINGYL